MRRLSRLADRLQILADGRPDSEEEWGMAYGLALPLAGTVAGTTDQDALLDALRGRVARAVVARTG